MNWLAIVKLVSAAVLSSNPKTAKISDEVQQGILLAEETFGPGKGGDKKQAVMEIAKQAANAADELRGHEDETLGEISTAVDHIIGATNAIIADTKAHK